MRMSHRCVVAELAMLKVAAAVRPLALACRQAGDQLVVGWIIQYPRMPLVPTSTRPFIIWKFSLPVGAVRLTVRIKPVL